MSRTKDANWPEEPRTPRPPSPIKHAIRAAWREFWRVRSQQKRRSQINDPFKDQP